MKQNEMINDEPQRRLSPWRVLFALLLLAGVSYGSIFGFKEYKEAKATTAAEPWFGAYVDATATPFYPFEQLGATETKNVVLSFIVSSPIDACMPTWGGHYTLTEASEKLDLERRIARLRQQGGNVVISFGGLLNDELGLKCTDSDKLFKAYKQVIDQYGVDTIDLDLEGEELTNLESLKTRAIALAKLQNQMRSENKNLAIWLTLPVAPQGLTNDGINAVSAMLSQDIDLSGVNVMTMDYGESKLKDDSMYIASKNALTETHRQLGILYKQAGITLNSDTLWSKIGATPMIGQNDVEGEIFGLEDASEFNKFTVSKGVGRMSMWSANRDLQCGDNYIDLKKVSDSCSGVEQKKFDFTKILSQSYDGSLAQNAAVVTVSDPDAELRSQKADDPATSPYQIWKENARYLTGTKVVWHGNVYQAKWWTQGDIPDNPVLQAWETPWQLLGPVLPGETPVPIPTLAPGTYEQWDGEKEYIGGQRVLFEGLPYQAKWWTKGDSPETASADSESSPWVALSQEQIYQLLKTNSAKKIESGKN